MNYFLKPFELRGNSYFQIKYHQEAATHLGEAWDQLKLLLFSYRANENAQVRQEATYGGLPACCSQLESIFNSEKQHLGRLSWELFPPQTALFLRTIFMGTYFPVSMARWERAWQLAWWQYLCSFLRTTWCFHRWRVCNPISPSAPWDELSLSLVTNIGTVRPLEEVSCWVCGYLMVLPNAVSPCHPCSPQQRIWSDLGPFH